MPELEAGEITLKYGSFAGTDDSSLSAVTASADLPTAFNALWLRSDRLSMMTPGHAVGTLAHSVQATEELCFYLSLAPECYQEFRLYTGDGHLCIERSWFELQESDPELSKQRLHNQHAVAASMQQCAAAHGLGGSVSDDETYVRLVRLKAPPSCE